MLTVLFLFVGAVAVNAADAKETIDVELNTEYDYPYLENSYYKFTAPKSGKLSVKTTKGNVPTPYTDNTFETALQPGVDYTRVGYTNKEITMNVTEGQIVWLWGKSWNKDNKLTLTMEDAAAISFKSVTPAEGSTLDVTGIGQITVNFSGGVKVKGNATLSSGTNAITLTPNVSGSMVYFNVKEQLMAWMKTGAVKEGDELTLTITNIVSALDESVKLGEDGKLTLKFKCPKMPTTLTKATVPAQFQTTWASGNTDGIVTLTFSNDLKADGITANLSIGSREDMKVYIESSDATDENLKLPMTISGNTITIDLTGKTRNVSDLIQGADLTKEEFKNWVLKISNVKDADGNYAYTDNQGAVGSFSFSMPVDGSTPAITTVKSDFTPANGTSLKGVDKIQIYIDPASKVSYTGVRFSYDNADNTRTTVIVKKSETDKITIEEDPVEDVANITCTIPDGVADANNVYVTLDTLTFAENAKGNIAAQYNVKTSDEFKVTLLEPAETTLAQLGGGQLIKVSTTQTDKVGYLFYVLTNKATGEVLKSRTELKKNIDDNTFSAEMPSAIITLDEGVNYAMAFSAWPSEKDWRNNENKIGEDTVTFTGTTPVFKFSPVKYVSIAPDPETHVIESVDDNKLTVTFDGQVKLTAATAYISLGANGNENFAAITPVGDNTSEDKSLSNVWELTIDKSFLKSQATAIQVVMFPRDADDLLVEGNEGEGQYSKLTFYYDCVAGTPDIEITPGTGTVYGSLFAFDVQHTKSSGMEGTGVSTSGLVSINKAVLTKDGVEVAKVVSAENYFPDDASMDANPSRVKIVLDREITEPGDYVLSFPYQYFLYGSQMFAISSKAENISYTIAAIPDAVTKDLTPVTIDPANESTVDSIQAIKLTFDREITINPSFQYAVRINNKAEKKQVFGYLTIDKADPKTVIVNADNKIKEDGNYNILIPAGAVGDATYGEAYTAGHCNDILNYFYTVGEETPVVTENVTVDPADGSTVTSLKKFILTWPDETEVNDTGEGDNLVIYDSNNNEVASIGGGGINAGEGWNQIEVEFKTEITAPGTYTLSIPAKRFALGANWDRFSAAHTFTYTIGDPSCINGIAADASGRYNVYNVAGVRVMSTTDKASLKSLKSGLYIVNGKKIAVK